jgi:prephenate dehydratase
VVAGPGTLPAPTGDDKTTIVVFECQDRVGALIELLQQFAAHGINMTRVESRPTGSAIGAYCFSIDIEGHVDQDDVGETLVSLRRITGDVRFLGSYPRAGTRRTAARHVTGDLSDEAARLWLSAVRAGDRAATGQRPALSD